MMYLNTQPVNKKAAKKLPSVLKTHFEYLDTKAMVDDAMDVSMHTRYGSCDTALTHKWHACTHHNLHHLQHCMLHHITPTQCSNGHGHNPSIFCSFEEA